MFFLILEREGLGGMGREEREEISVREKHQLVATCMCPNGDQTPQPRCML